MLLSIFTQPCVMSSFDWNFCHSCYIEMDIVKSENKSTHFSLEPCENQVGQSIDDPSRNGEVSMPPNLFLLKQTLSCQVYNPIIQYSWQLAQKKTLTHPAEAQITINLSTLFVLLGVSISRATRRSRLRLKRRGSRPSHFVIKNFATRHMLKVRTTDSWTSYTKTFVNALLSRLSVKVVRYVHSTS